MVQSVDSCGYLPDQTTLLLDLDDNAFKRRELTLHMDKVDAPENVVSFVNLDSLWYGLSEQSDDGQTYHKVELMTDMNEPGARKVNLFDGKMLPEETQTFNDWLKSNHMVVNSLVENKFYRNAGFDADDASATDPAKVIAQCKYLMCVEGGLSRFYGLEIYTNADGSRGFRRHSIAENVMNMESGLGLVFKECGFHVFGKDDELTMIVTAVDNAGKYHFFYLNESTYDPTYGFPELTSVVVDGLILPFDQVFSKVQSLRQLDNVSIAMTDYGFWDLEVNSTNDVTYVYNGNKEIDQLGASINDDASKVIHPEKNIPSGTLYSEYDTLWQKSSGSWNRYTWDQGLGEWKPDAGSGDHEKSIIPYPNVIKPDGESHEFRGGTDVFAVYGKTTNHPLQLLVNMSKDQFKRLLYGDSTLASTFVDWLYHQVVYADECEHYLENTHAGFASRVNAKIDSSSTWANVEYSLPKVNVNDKFKTMKAFIDGVGSNNSLNALTKYCTRLQEFKNTNFSTYGYSAPHLIQPSSSADATLKNLMATSF